MTSVVMMEHVYNQTLSVTDIMIVGMELMKLTVVSNYVAATGIV